jgi:putative ABC transport system substrate-binding protein
VIDRRAFLVVLAGGALVTQSAAAQQPTKVWRIGFLNAASRQRIDEFGGADAFVKAMHDLGYVEGRNLVIEWRHADGNYDRLPALADEFVRLKVDVIVAVASPAIRAAQRATSTIPIVFPTTGDPVGSGFAKSLSRPGYNLTGLSNSNLDVSAKTMELLQAVVPKIARVAVLANPGSSTEPAMLRSIDTAARNVGAQTLLVEVRTLEDIEQGFATMKRERADALFIGADSFINMQSRRIAELALGHRLPSVSQGSTYARAGGLMSYGSNAGDNYARAAAYVDKILKGANPAELPIEQPTKLLLTINMRTAKALGLAIPQSLLLRADEVIQ